ncbi:hypothetical protein J437_LFUL001430 [Ladona fulva]|uniref:Tyrosine decarboxylase n=1 Tax=Ladona fulva TaxID=123851 RepID=A0A8K0NUL2_LADFU|nr:hypothetical protein J437_LFUL001430 [Ladona fulva]
MNTDEFRQAGKEMVDYICDYMETLAVKRRVTSAVKPGYLKNMIPEEAPERPEPWDNIMSDIEAKIMPGITHWQHPRFHAYFPSGNSYPSILGDLLSDGVGIIGFSWASSPVCQELETIVLDWLGKAIGLPDEFLSCTQGGKGGGVMQGSASECILVNMLAARAEAIKRLKKDEPKAEDGHLLARLVAYCSQEAHSCVEKAAKICMVKLRIIEPDEKSSLRGEQLRQYASSFNTNPNKWLLTNFDCSTMWVRDRFKFTEAMVVDPIYLQHNHDSQVIDYRHWGIPLSRRFRALKLWFVIRSYGLEGLREYIRNHCRLAKKFESYVRDDRRFEVCNDVKLGLVCFRLKRNNKINQELLVRINYSEKLFIIPSLIGKKYILRFCVVAERATEEDIKYAWDVITSIAAEVLEESERAEKANKLPEILGAAKVPPTAAGDKPLFQHISQQFSFTKSLSRDVYQRYISKKSLHDGVSPIVVVDEEEDQEN